VVTPGNNRDEILRVVRALGSDFEQVVLLGYPPFVKDVVDTGRARGLDWQRYRIKLVLAGEVFSEEWRTLVGERTGARRPCHDSASLYGTADAGVLGVETPLSVCIRRYLAAEPEAAGALFGDVRLPTLVQYDPASRFFEVDNGTLLFSGDNGVPLVRYHIADEGGLVPYEPMLAFVRERGFDPPAGRPLPFVYVFGRSHFTVSYYGANVYPENVTVALEQAPISDWTTGKFVLEAREDEDRDAYLSVVVELAPGAEGGPERARAVADAVVAQLLRLNSEFASYVPAGRRPPRVMFAPAGDPEWFPVGVKHRYTRGPAAARE
jgi:phenylacetate-CoA ligase